MNTNSHIASITLQGQAQSEFASRLSQEQKTALNELALQSFFKPVNEEHGPYDVSLSIQDHRLVVEFATSDGTYLTSFVLSLKPYRRLIQDYFLMIGSYEKARREFGREKLEAIDMGRRGIHNEAAELFQDRLKDKIEMDFETARKLFTLICALHKDQVQLMN